jgi:membrane associated rhomboid family serine protease
VLPLKDNVPTRHFPIVTLGLVLINVAVWILYENAGIGTRFEQSVNEAAYHPCEFEDSCPVVGEDWPLTSFTSMFMHGGWDHLIGNMLFLWIFGNNVEDALGRVRFVIFYLLGGYAATALQTFVTLQYGTEQDATIPNLGASGAISAVLGGYFLMLPGASVLTLIFFFILREIRAFWFLGIWFFFQLWQGNYALTHPQQGGGVAFFAHIGGFVFGMLTVYLFRKRAPLRPHY